MNKIKSLFIALIISSLGVASAAGLSVTKSAKNPSASKFASDFFEETVLAFKIKNTSDKKIKFRHVNLKLNGNIQSNEDFVFGFRYRGYVYESKVTESREAKMNGGTRLQTRRPITLKPGQEEEYTIVLNSPLKKGVAAGKSFTVSLTGIETFKGEPSTGLPLTSASFSL